MNVCRHPKCSVVPSKKYLATGFCHEHQRPDRMRDSGKVKSRLLEVIESGGDIFQPPKPKKPKPVSPSLKPDDEMVAKIREMKHKENPTPEDVEWFKDVASKNFMLAINVAPSMPTDAIIEAYQNSGKSFSFKKLLSLAKTLVKAGHDSEKVKLLFDTELKPSEAGKYNALFRRVQPIHRNTNLKTLGGFDEVLAADRWETREFVYRRMEQLTPEQWDMVDPKVWLPEMVDSAWERDDQVFCTPRDFEAETVANRIAEKGNVCESCGATNIEVSADHLVPRALGGNSTAANLRLMCPPCNFRKGSVFDPLWLEELYENPDWCPTPKHLSRI